MSRFRLWGLLLAFIGSAACSRSDTVDELWPGAPLQACQSSSQCVEGLCVCGLCTERCGGGQDTSACGDGRNCFASGSIGYAATCGAVSTSASGAGSTPIGLCLSQCALDEQCGEGQECLSGACVPTTRPQAPLAIVADAGVGALPAAGLGAPSFERSPNVNWLLDAEALESVSSSELAKRFECPNSPDCAPLEEVLRTDDCQIIQSGCGLIQVSLGLFGPTTFRSWFDSFDSPPVGKRDGNGSLLSTRDLSCNQVEVVCSACDYAAEVSLACEDAPDFWPPRPESAPIDGCSCEPEGERRSRVSLECFCSIHDCPTLSDTLLSCREHELSKAYPISATAGCGLIWFVYQNASGKKLGYDPVTGELVAAHVYTPGGPVAKPCNSFTVFGGKATQCEEERYDFGQERSAGSYTMPEVECSCLGGGQRVDYGCEVETWYQQLPGYQAPTE